MRRDTLSASLRSQDWPSKAFLRVYLSTNVATMSIPSCLHASMPILTEQAENIDFQKTVADQMTTVEVLKQALHRRMPCAAPSAYQWQLTALSLSLSAERDLIIWGCGVREVGSLVVSALCSRGASAAQLCERVARCRTVSPEAQ